MEPTRRQVIAGAAAAGVAAAVAGRSPLDLAAEAEAAETAGPFRHGVASGDPLVDRVVL